MKLVFVLKLETSKTGVLLRDLDGDKVQLMMNFVSFRQSFVVDEIEGFALASSSNRFENSLKQTLFKALR
jgi:hypothetical protein